MMPISGDVATSAQPIRFPYDASLFFLGGICIVPTLTDTFGSNSKGAGSDASLVHFLLQRTAVWSHHLIALTSLSCNSLQLNNTTLTLYTSKNAYRFQYPQFGQIFKLLSVGG